MEATIEHVGNVMVVTLPHEMLDAGNVADFKSDMMATIDGHTHVIFDMSSLRFVDSSGLGAILSCLRKLHAEGGDLKLCGMTKPVRALFELVRMHRIFEIFNTADEALRAFDNDQ